MVVIVADESIGKWAKTCTISDWWERKWNSACAYDQQSGKFVEIFLFWWWMKWMMMVLVCMYVCIVCGGERKATRHTRRMEYQSSKGKSIVLVLLYIYIYIYDY